LVEQRAEVLAVKDMVEEETLEDEENRGSGVKCNAASPCRRARATAKRRPGLKREARGGGRAAG